MIDPHALSRPRRNYRQALSARQFPKLALREAATIAACRKRRAELAALLAGERRPGPLERLFGKCLALHMDGAAPRSALT